MESNHDKLTQKVIYLEDTLDKNSEEVAVVQSSITCLLQEHKILEHELDNLKKTCVTQTSLEERVAEKVSQMLQTQQQNHLPCTVNDLPLREIGFDTETECRLEAMEQYSRRDCLLFFGLHEKEFEDCTEKNSPNCPCYGREYYCCRRLNHPPPTNQNPPKRRAEAK